MSFKFKKLNVWQKAVEVALDVHDLTKNFPKDDLFILSSQIKRAEDSVSLNIAEGFNGQSNADFNRFIGYSLRLTIEVAGCLFLAKKRNLPDETEFTKLYKQYEEVPAKLTPLRKSIKS